MEILRNLLGNLGSGLIRLLVAVGILAAAYLFILRPVLDTSKKIPRELHKSLEGYGKNGAGIEDVAKTVREASKQVQREIRRSFHLAESHGVLSPKRLVKCIERADGNAHKIQRCTVKF